MPVKFFQPEGVKFDSTKDITGIEVTPVAHVNDLKYKSKYWLAKKKDKEKADLIREINELIAEFNDLNTDLSRGGTFIWDDSVNRFSYHKVEDEYFKRKGLRNHLQYLTQYDHDILFNLNKTLDRLCYIRTKEFEGFLKSLEGKKSDAILREIRKFKKDKFDSWKKDVQDATLGNFDFMLNQIIKKYLKPKQKSRKKQLLKKFKEWHNRLLNPKNFNEEVFAGVTNSLVELFGIEPHNLTDNEIRVLKDCFGKDRSWTVAWSGSLAPQYNPFPGLDEGTNRVAIALFGLITDGDGKHIDPAIQLYLKRPLTGTTIPKNKRKHGKSSRR